MGLLDLAWSTLVNLVTPLFVSSDGSNTAKPGRINATSKGIEVHVVGGTEESDQPLGAWTDHDPIDVPTEPSAAQQLGDHSCTEIKYAADPNNVYPIYVSGSSVSSTKTPGLNAEDLEIVKRVENSNEFYVVAAAGHSGQKLRYQTR